MQPVSVRILPLFEAELAEILDYIGLHLQNPDAAIRLEEDIFAAIRERAASATAFQPIPVMRKHSEVYYPIRVRNYTIVYVVLGDVMEVRRIFYTPSDWQKRL